MSANGEKLERRTRKWMWWAAISTGIWLLFCLGVFFGVESLFGLSLNEFGDFVGGVVGPIALLWVMMGVLQQGEDLRLQKIELRKHVEATERLANIDRELLEHERAVRGAEESRRADEEEKARPRFGYRNAIPIANSDGCKIFFENLGGSFLVKRIYSIEQNKRVVLEDGVPRTIDAGDMPFFRISPIDHNERIRFLLAISYGRGHVGTMEIVGNLGESLQVNLEERV